jgi:superfamily II DNA or RNA helicase
MMELFDYQKQVVDELEAKIAEGVRRILVSLPTGGGKTVVAGENVRRAVAQSKRVVFIAHRDELLTQARRTIARFDINAGIIKSGRDKDLRPQSLVQVCGIATLHTRAMRLGTMELPSADVVIVDEGHHGRARTYEEIIAAYPNAIIIGLTATPCRTDGRGLGNVFDVLVEGPQIAELIAMGRLVPPKIYAPPPPNLTGVQTAKTGDYVIRQLSERMNTEVLVGDVVEHYLRFGQGRRAVCFTVDVAHSVHLARELVKAGLKAEHLDGTTKQAEREQILARLARGETQVVCNCAVLTEGFDLPELACIILARPTKSLLLYRQMIGRGMRTAPGKTDCLILDHAGAVHLHGLPTDRIEWTLETDKRAANKAHEARKREHQDPFCECTKCGHLRQRGFACDNCGWQPQRRGEGIGYRDEDLIEIGATKRAEIDQQKFYAELRGYAQRRVTKSGAPYSPKWAAHKYREKFGPFPPWSWNDLPARAPSPATLRWIQSRNIAYAKAKAS